MSFWLSPGFDVTVRASLPRECSVHNARDLKTQVGMELWTCTSASPPVKAPVPTMGDRLYGWFLAPWPSAPCPGPLRLTPFQGHRESQLFLNSVKTDVLRKRRGEGRKGKEGRRSKKRRGEEGGDEERCLKHYKACFKKITWRKNIWKTMLYNYQIVFTILWKPSMQIKT